ncbi:hypothetical protein GBB67_04475, partial [Bifidobacterium longum]
ENRTQDTGHVSISGPQPICAKSRALSRKHRGGLSCLFASRHDVYRGAGIAGIRDIYAKVMLDEIDESDQPDGDLFRKGDAEIQGPRGWSFWFWIGALGCGCRVRHV